MTDILNFPTQSERIRREIERPLRTAWDIGEEATARRPALRKFGAALVRSPIREAIEQADRDSNNNDPPEAA